jgi:hypothetical protein
VIALVIALVVAVGALGYVFGQNSADSPAQSSAPSTPSTLGERYREEQRQRLDNDFLICCASLAEREAYGAFANAMNGIDKELNCAALREDGFTFVAETVHKQHQDVPVDEVLQTLRSDVP